MSNQPCIWWIPPDEGDDGEDTRPVNVVTRPALAVSNSAAAKLYDAAVANAPIPKIAAPPPKKKKAAAKRAQVTIEHDIPTLPLFAMPPKPVPKKKPKAAAKPKIKKTAAAKKKPSSLDSALSKIAKAVPSGITITIKK